MVNFVSHSVRGIFMKAQTPLDRLSGSPADIIVNGELVGRGDVVVIDEHFGVRVTKLIDPAERIKSA